MANKKDIIDALKVIAKHTKNSKKRELKMENYDWYIYITDENTQRNLSDYLNKRHLFQETKEIKYGGKPINVFKVDVDSVKWATNKNNETFKYEKILYRSKKSKSGFYIEYK